MSGTLRLGPFVLDVHGRELRRGHHPVRLSPKGFQLLELLVTNRPRALSKSALQEHLWPQTFVVEKNLVNLIAEIRDALGDDPASPRFIRTIHRFGYAFQESSVTMAEGETGHGEARFRLVWKDGRAGLGDGEHVLGRDPDLTLFLDSPRVSRRHARITISGTDATVEDLGSKNGTFVGDRRVESRSPLADGDRLRVGSVELTFTALQADRPTETEPERSSRTRQVYTK